jgi:pyruvate/2-oxoglutarate/acetoin dehydrogenase E1 component
MEAIVEAIEQAMAADPRVFYIGQDARVFGGAMQGTRGLYERFGPERILEAPISEMAMVGAAVGAAMFGRRPIVEISFGEFLPAGMNQLINQAPNIFYMTAGAARCPLVVRTRVGDGPYGGHPQDYTSWFPHIPGWKVAVPASPADAKGLMTAAIRDDNPVLFVEGMSLSHSQREAVPVEPYTVPFGQARVARPGTDVTIVSWGSMVPVCMQASTHLAAEAIHAEVVDLRTLAPWDFATVVTSVRKTRRLAVVHETWVTGGFGAEVVATVAEQAYGALAASPVRVGAPAVPIPSGPLRKLALPGASDVVSAVRQVMNQSDA